MKRDRKIITILGRKRIGKTYLARKYFAKHAGPTKIVLDPSGNWKEGEFPPDAFANKKALEKWAAQVSGNGMGPPHSKRVDMQGGLLILDDADDYVSAAPFSYWKTFWNRNAHLRLDLIVTAHRPQGVPKDLLANSDQLILFSMGEKYALDYFAETPGLEMLGARNAKGERLLTLPTEKGRALVWTAETQSISYLDFSKELHDGK